MYVDLRAVLTATVEPGVGEQELDALDDRVRAAHERIAQGRTNDESDYTALNHPEATDADAIRRRSNPSGTPSPFSQSASAVPRSVLELSWQR